jgi:prepilin-type N-terminal cleavage/methylation domain-containing protein
MSSPSVQYRQAFTLIEVVIVMAIIAVVSVIAIVSFATTRTDGQVKQAAHLVAGSLREAQNYALSGRSTGTAQDNCWYGVSMSGTGYSLFNRYKAAGVCSAQATIGNFTLPAGVSFGASEIIGFSLPRSEPLYYNGSSMVALTTSRLIQLVKGGRSFYLCVYSTGRVEERGMSASCP